MLSEPRHAPFASWVCGWFNLLGQVAVTTGIRFVLARGLQTVFSTPSAQLRMRKLHLDRRHLRHVLRAQREDDDRHLRRGARRTGYGAPLLCIRVPQLTRAPGLINTFGVHLLRYLNNISVWWHAVGTTALVIAILAKAPTHQSAKFVFQTFIDGTGVDGVGWSVRASPAYVVVVSGF